MASRKKKRNSYFERGIVATDMQPEETPEDLPKHIPIPDDYEKDDELDGWLMPEWDT